ncbi:MAG: YlxR family protein [Clostridia bacterium]|nr:YlxR family protein [Clostridia bacterium]
MKTVKRIPERMCVACRQMKPKNQLVRIVNTENGVVVDTTGKLNGRGVYLCKCKECINRATKNKGFAKTNGFALDEQIVSQLESLIEQ